MNKRKQAKGGEKKSSAITWKTLYSDRRIAATTVPGIEKVLSQRSLLLRSPRSLESGFQMIATIAAMAELFFFLSDRRDHSDRMETRLKEV